MRRVVSIIAIQIVVAGALIAASAPSALAARHKAGGGGGGGGGGGTTSSSTATGNDVSYPQCGSSLPSSPAFGIVGVNGGLANDLNPCLGPSTAYSSYSQSELYWALASSTGVTAQPRASLYVNTADPGNMYNGTAILDWPTSGTTPYGDCITTTVTTSTGPQTVGMNSAACAWEYGYQKATQDVSWLAGAAGAIQAQETSVAVPAGAGSYPWWLDVETANSWQTGTAGQAMNVADLEGMVAALQGAGASVIGAYSTSSQWDTITGGTTSSSSLAGIPDWIPGAKKLSGAESNCHLASFTAGTVSVTQWSGHPDKDYAC